MLALCAIAARPPVANAQRCVSQLILGGASAGRGQREEAESALARTCMLSSSSLTPCTAAAAQPPRSLLAKQQLLYGSSLRVERRGAARDVLEDAL